MIIQQAAKFGRLHILVNNAAMQRGRQAINAKNPMPQERVEISAGMASLARLGQPAELAGTYVLPASDEASHITGAVIPVTGGKPMLQVRVRPRSLSEGGRTSLSCQGRFRSSSVENAEGPRRSARAPVQP